VGGSVCSVHRPVHGEKRKWLIANRSMFLRWESGIGMVRGPYTHV
jgi:hypothetical protein